MMADGQALMLRIAIRRPKRSILRAQHRVKTTSLFVGDLRAFQRFATFSAICHVFGDYSRQVVTRTLQK
jgi:hypothetical protein